MTRLRLLGLCLVVACGGDDGGGADTPDAGTGSCDVLVSFEPTSPAAPVTVVASASIVRNGVSVGVESFTWDVSRDDVNIAVNMRDAEGREVEFLADLAGTYRVAVGGSVGGVTCADAVQTVSVTQSGATTQLYRLRLYPATGQDVPVQQRVVAIPGGADYALGTISLDTGVPVSAFVTRPGVGPLESFLRFERVGDDTWPARELFAGTNGAFEVRLAPGGYDILVIPTTSEVAPSLRTVASVAGISQLQMSDGIQVSGTVVDGGGAPLQDVSVSLRAAGAPSTIATTSATGAFALRCRPGEAAVTVRPPRASGLPTLEAPASAATAVADGGTLSVSYASLAVRDVDLEVRQSDGTTPAPGAQLVVVSRAIPDAGTVTVGGGAPVAATGHVRVSAVADAQGRVTGLRLPDAAYDVIVIPGQGAADAVHLVSLDTTGGAPLPTSVSLAMVGTATGVVRDEQGAPLAGVRVSATPRGLLLGTPGAAFVTSTNAAGEYTLDLVGGGDYELSFAPATRVYAATRVAVTAPASGGTAAVADTVLPDAIQVSGQLTLPGATGAAGVYLQLLCMDCVGTDATAPVAEGVTDATGRFSLGVPDPGTGE